MILIAIGAIPYAGTAHPRVSKKMG
jgi:hypothetical protein